MAGEPELSDAMTGGQAERRLQIFLRSDLARGLAVFVILLYLARLLVGVFVILSGKDIPVLVDYICFWMASDLLLSGHALTLYDFSSFSSLQAQVFQTSGLAFFYPPTWLLYIWPISLIPFLPSALLFQGICAGLAAVSLAFLARHRDAGWLFLAFPPIAFCVLYGQNGMFNLALLAGALACLDRGRHLAAGLLIGLMTFKPHLGVLIPFALLAGGYWRAFWAAAVVSIFLAGLSSALFGQELWLAFFKQLDFTSRWLMEGMTPQQKYASTLGFLRQFGVATSVAMCFQIAVSLACLAAVVWSWRRAVPLVLKGSVLASAAIAATPYALDYDTALLAVSMVVLVRFIVIGGPLRWEGPGLVLALFCLIASEGWGLSLPTTLTALAPILLVLLSLRRVHAFQPHLPFTSEATVLPGSPTR